MWAEHGGQRLRGGIYLALVAVFEADVDEARKRRIAETLALLRFMLIECLVVIINDLADNGLFGLAFLINTVKVSESKSVLAGSGNEEELLALLREHLEATGSPCAAAKLADWENERSRFVKVIPVEYRHAMASQKKEE